MSASFPSYFSNNLNACVFQSVSGCRLEINLKVWTGFFLENGCSTVMNMLEDSLVLCNPEIILESVVNQ